MLPLQWWWWHMTNTKKCVHTLPNSHRRFLVALLKKRRTQKSLIFLLTVKAINGFKLEGYAHNVIIFMCVSSLKKGMSFRSWYTLFGAPIVKLISIKDVLVCAGIFFAYYFPLLRSENMIKWKYNVIRQYTRVGQLCASPHEKNSGQKKPERRKEEGLSK